jgi:hypothetical protein
MWTAALAVTGVLLMRFANSRQSAVSSSLHCGRSPVTSPM